ncbi:hypothetical protein F5Y14DRAFT_441773 [Nemania sp. NC0429]|nr:hypothetical protein F5Y14DRAFT_441773 [Nemania sp. NC0429]
MAEGPSSLRTQLLSIRKYSDLILECDGQEFNVHRAQVCAQSPVFAAALESDFIEAKTGRVKVSFEIESVRRMIEFMYTGDYQLAYNSALDLISSESGVHDTSATNERQGDGEIDTAVEALKLSDSMSDRLISHGRMNIIADYYDIAGLAKLSSAKTQEILANEWSVELFCDLLQQCLHSTRDKTYFRMLAAEAGKHIDELSERHVFDEDGLGEELAPYVLRSCMPGLQAAKARVLDLLVQPLPFFQYKG